MKYLYFYLWLGLAIMYKKMGQLIYKPIVSFFNYFLRKNNEELEKSRKESSDALFDFPHGGADWWAFGIFCFIHYIPLIVLVIYFPNELSFFKNKILTGAVFLSIAGILYYIIYFKKIDWLKKRIKEAKKKYKLEL